MKNKTRFLAVGAGSLALLLTLGVGFATAADNETDEDLALDEKLTGMMARNEAIHAMMKKMQAPAWGGPRDHGMSEMRLTEGDDGTFSSKAVHFAADPEAGAITNFTYTDKAGNATTLALRMTLASDAGNATMGELGRHGYVVAAGDSAKLMLHGMPRVHAWASAPSTLTIELPEGANVTLRDAVPDWSPAGATIDYGTEKANLRLSEGATLTVDGLMLTVHLDGGDSVMFHVAHDDMMGGHGMRHGGYHGAGGHRHR